MILNIMLMIKTVQDCVSTLAGCREFYPGTVLKTNGEEVT